MDQSEIIGPPSEAKVKVQQPQLSLSANRVHVQSQKPMGDVVLSSSSSSLNHRAPQPFSVNQLNNNKNINNPYLVNSQINNNVYINNSNNNNNKFLMSNRLTTSNNFNKANFAVNNNTPTNNSTTNINSNLHLNNMNAVPSTASAVMTMVPPSTSSNGQNNPINNNNLLLNNNVTTNISSATINHTSITKNMNVNQSNNLSSLTSTNNKNFIDSSTTAPLLFSPQTAALNTQNLPANFIQVTASSNHQSPPTNGSDATHNPINNNNNISNNSSSNFFNNMSSNPISQTVNAMSGVAQMNSSGRTTASSTTIPFSNQQTQQEQQMHTPSSAALHLEAQATNSPTLSSYMPSSQMLINSQQTSTGNHGSNSNNELPLDSINRDPPPFHFSFRTAQQNQQQQVNSLPPAY
eukprot:GDKJ01023241.1.p1 GENE.GDKJ01023241.1~~GDKJ01023241.1.p1  ORF type:complete len:464 (-),score=147.02 GDKJ01023241.1:4032-5252(-)